MSKNRMFRYLFLLIAFVGLEGCQETPTDADVNIDEIFSTDTVEDGLQRKLLQYKGYAGEQSRKW